MAANDSNSSLKTRSQSLPRSAHNPLNGDVNARNRFPVRVQILNNNQPLPQNKDQRKPPRDEDKSIDPRIAKILSNYSHELNNYLDKVLRDLGNQRETRLEIANVGSVLPKLKAKLERTLIKEIEKLKSPAVEINTDNGRQQTRSSNGPLPPLPGNVSPLKLPHSIQFAVPSINSKISSLFESLKSLRHMDKYGPLSGKCERETEQMEYFLKESFGFQNIPGQSIVHGVQAFTLRKPIDSLPSDLIIQFPHNDADISRSFMMTKKEIEEWQQSYHVYAFKSIQGMNNDFLVHALQGRSRYGQEAFLMKFVVRVSQCPILMDFDAQIITRTLNESWPHNIKLVSVTGIDFAGRIHDVDDIRSYVTNWREVYEIDHQSDLPRVYNGRDFRRRDNGPRGQLNENLLLQDLKLMARLRLQACDLEQVQVVVETGIGLGVFAGKYIGIDETVRLCSAIAIRQVLDEDGNNYKYIKAVVFALPIFDNDLRNGRREDTFHAFETVFRKDNYRGRIPVLIIDQDMHRLTVAIARQGLRVSELNPADSHGVFGEYWQNRGPAVEEKLALTTVGLLVQHHLINPHVLDSANYSLI